MSEWTSCKIYALVDPVSRDIKYIGQTIKTLSVRLEKHIYDAKRVNKSKVHKWINSVLLNGLRPEIVLIDGNAEWNISEIEYIKQYKDKGILNQTNGGDGTVGLVRTLEHKSKISKANKGKIRSEEAKIKYSEAHKGKKLNEEHRKNISLALKNKPKSKEHSIKAGLAHKGVYFYRLLPIEKVIEIINKYKMGNISQRKLAKEYNVSRSYIQYYLKREKRNGKE